MTIYNFHTHSKFDDGQGSPADYVAAAKENGLAALGFSAHVPLPMSNHWSLPAKDFESYTSEIARLKQQNNGNLKLYLGLEIDYIPKVSEHFEQWMSTPLDYCIGSVHLVKAPRHEGFWFIDGPAEGYFQGIESLFEGDIRKAVTAFYEQSMDMVRTQPMNIIGHLDKVKMHNKEQHFGQDELWYRSLVERLLKVIKEKDVIVELNTRGVYSGKCTEYFPSPFVMEQCLHLGIPVMVNTDAHRPDQLTSHFEEGMSMLRGIGFRKITTPFFETEI